MDKMPPAQMLWGIINSNVLARCVQVVAEYGVADALADRPMKAAELAAQTGMNADALRRMLRLLAAHEVFTQEGDLYRHTPVSELLCTAGGQERTPSEYKALLSRAGFRLERIIAPPSQYSIIETVVI